MASCHREHVLIPLAANNVHDSCRHRSACSDCYEMHLISVDGVWSILVVLFSPLFVHNSYYFRRIKVDNTPMPYAYAARGIKEWFVIRQ